MTAADVTGDATSANDDARGSTLARLSVPRAAPYAWGIVLLLAYTTLSVARFERLGTRSWDTAIFTQIVKGYASLSAPIIDVKGPGFNALGDHFSPLIAVIAPFYALFPTPVTLFVAQAFCVAASAAIVMHAAMKHLGPGAGVPIGIAYGLSFGLQAGVDAEFHEYALAVPLLALAGHAFLDRRWGQVAFWTSLLLLVKEDLGLTVATMGVVLLIVGARRWGAGLVVVGLLGFALTTLVVIPLLNPDGVYLYWSRFGEGTPGGIGGLVTGAVQAMYTPGVKVETLLLTLGITGFFALRSPLILLIAPNIAMRFLGNVDFYWGLEWHYAMPIMPVLFIAVVDAIRRSRECGPGWVRTYARHVPAVVVAVSLVLLLQTPLRNLVQPPTYADNPREAAAGQVVGMIPVGAVVETDIGLITQVAADHDVFFLGLAGSVVPDYVLIDANAGWNPAPSDIAAYAESLHPKADYRSAFSADGYALAELVPRPR